MNWKNTMMQMKLMKHYFIASALVFIAGIVMGALYSSQFHAFINGQIEAIKQISGSIAGKPNQQWSLFWLIFWNNALKSLLVIALGLFFGVFPLFFLLANGLLLGYVCMVSAQKQSWLFVIKTILPHGILEIPAIIVACALGLRLGMMVLKTLLSSLSPTRSVKTREQFLLFIKALLPLSVMLVAVLFVAALIESTLTLWLARG
ncbi:stage II sporulation protein M [Paenibacillus tianmuensis]|uniref:Stage II sporulation protein M n=1 Tax=Paenibacillus tianmuensis TaxID=624147 RepID=A0A1G4SVL6_9BACL|nr:stage II sporulation protein M [Paenibacillus tianmuensis]SCW72987.1 stage II sporulation protein M [Paenibacillus tianmuensis]